jgi:hypothetical protein
VIEETSFALILVVKATFDVEVVSRYMPVVILLALIKTSFTIVVGTMTFAVRVNYAVEQTFTLTVKVTFTFWVTSTTCAVEGTFATTPVLVHQVTFVKVSPIRAVTLAVKVTIFVVVRVMTFGVWVFFGVT